ncbi:low temperature requirement protein A [Microbacterium timonense]|uniref:low temperature requirement protein A n=1 Tax=Microbacterium timonense TaxID=2086576 RepID=UPI000D113989|nr:low temperature requirement protein A [Microbacterium timonense]
MSTIRRPGLPRVSPLELFYDLVFVVVIQQLSVRVESGAAVADYLAVAGLTVAIWLCWLNQLLLMNQLAARNGMEVTLVLIAMAGLGVIAISFGDPAVWDPRLFVIGYVAARTALWPLWSRTPVRRTLWTPFVFGPVLALLWLVTLALPPVLMPAAWVILVAVEVSIVVTGLPSVAHNAGHLTERAGLFVLILLGDCIAETVTALEPASPAPVWFAAAAAFVTTCVVWVNYFMLGPYAARRSTSRAAPEYVRDVILLAHLLLVLGLLLLAAGFNSAIDHATTAPAPAAARIGICSGLLLILCGQALMSVRSGVPLRRTASWFLPLALIVAVPLIAAPVVDQLPSYAVGCLAVGAQAAVAVAGVRERRLSAGRVS